jgi:hypothetical protein
MANPQDVVVNATPLTFDTTPSEITGQLVSPTDAGMIRNISQTAQEREIVKTAPDVVVFIDGLPYIPNFFISDPRSPKSNKTLVNFNDHIISFSATYDTDSMVPNCSIGLSVPNFQKYLYQMPGGNNLFQSMSQIQVYAKSYFIAANADTVYRRVFKGVISYIGYVDNGKTLDITLQCQGILYLLEKMQVNIHPSANTAHKTAENQTIFQSRYSSGDCFEIIAMAFLDGLRSDMFQISSLKSAPMAAASPFYDAINRGYMAKWQAILWNMVKDVHVYGPFKDSLGDTTPMTKDPIWGDPAKMTSAGAATKRSGLTETQKTTQYNQYYSNITKYLPFKNITSLDLTNNVITNRLDVIREVVRKIDFEAYQDVDGKVIVKPPLYNLDVVNLGPTSNMTTTLDDSSHNSLTNPATAIHENNNPFVIYLSEILTEQENEDQSAIRRTRTTVVGNAMRDLGNNYRDDTKAVGEFIDVSKLAKFGLREEPTYQVAWLSAWDQYALFAHAAAETARANRGYRTYTFTIPMRPELKLGFPVFIPHRDMYAYIKTISLNYQVGGTATMTVSCDTIRRRILVSTKQPKGSGIEAEILTPAPNLIYQWTDNPQPQNQTNPSQAASTQDYWNNTYSTLSQGSIGGVSNDPSNITALVGSAVTLPVPGVNFDGSKTGPTAQEEKVHTIRTQVIGSKRGNQPSTPSATYVIKNDRVQNPFFPDSGVSVSKAYIDMICGNPVTHTNSVMPFTDTKGYEVVSPFPWGRWQTLVDAVREFTENGWIVKNQDLAGNNSQNLTDLAILNNTNAFLFAGLGTPTATNDPSTQLQTALQSQISLVGGSNQATVRQGPANTDATTVAQVLNQKFSFQPDATVIVLHYDPAMPGADATNTLLNAEQPENAFARLQLAGTQNALQQTVDVLVSGSVSPTPAVQESLLAAQNPPPNADAVAAHNLALTKITQGGTG